MKTAAFILLALAFGSCITLVEGPGAPGYDGNAYFGVDYDYEAPYGYWDNNPDIPEDPFLGEYYLTYRGIYDFEFYETRRDFWYGTYEIFINYGGPGRPYGEPGRNGRDTYLLLVLGNNGPYEYRKAALADTNIKAMEVLIDEKSSREYILEYEGGAKMHVKMQRGKGEMQRPESELKIKF